MEKRHLLLMAGLLISGTCAALPATFRLVGQLDGHMQLFSDEDSLADFSWKMEFTEYGYYAAKTKGSKPWGSTYPIADNGNFSIPGQFTYAVNTRLSLHIGGDLYLVHNKSGQRVRDSEIFGKIYPKKLNSPRNPVRFYSKSYAEVPHLDLSALKLVKAHALSPRPVVLKVTKGQETFDLGEINSDAKLRERLGLATPLLFQEHEFNPNSQERAFGVLKPTPLQLDSYFFMISLDRDRSDYFMSKELRATVLFLEPNNKGGYRMRVTTAMRKLTMEMRDDGAHWTLPEGEPVVFEIRLDLLEGKKPHTIDEPSWQVAKLRSVFNLRPLPGEGV